jgi:hypothetical protein
MKSLTLLITLLFISIQSISSQFINDGATIKISAGATLYVESDIENNNLGQIINEGDIELTGDLTNNATLTSGISSKISFSGNANSTITSGGAILNNLDMKKTSADLLLGDVLNILGIVDFVNSDNQIALDDKNFILGSGATITNFNATKYFITGNTGELKKKNLSGSFTFPIGYDDASYNPATLTEVGTFDTIGVRVAENVLKNGTSGAILTNKVVKAAWHITEENTGGSNITLNLSWAGGDHGIDFTIMDCGVSRYDTDHWDLTNDDAGMASGSGPYNMQRGNFSNLGVFSVGSDPLMDSIKFVANVYLEGPFNGTDMNDNLRGFGYIPVTEPYTALGFMHEGRGGGEEVTDSATVFGITGNNAIVDWVMLEIRDKNDATNILGSRSALIQRDGDIVDLDGVSSINFKGFSPDNYFVAVRHRLHLGFRSNASQALSRVSSNLAFGDGTIPTFGSNALKNVSGVYVMYSGNGNYDATINAIDKNDFWRIQNGTNYIYLDSTADFDLNAVINAVDKNNHWRINNGTIEQLD